MQNLSPWRCRHDCYSLWKGKAVTLSDHLTWYRHLLIRYRIQFSHCLHRESFIS